MMKLLPILAGLLLTACSNHEALQFYMLNADAEPAAEGRIAAFDKQHLVGLGPIRVPDYLDRPQLVVEAGPNRYRLDEGHRWAERLEQNIGRVLAQLLAERLGLDRVERFPWSQKQAIDYQVGIDILALHQAADGQSVLSAQWQIKYRDQAALNRRFECRIAAADQADAIVRAQSLCLGRLGLDIATGLRQAAAGS